MPDLDGTGPRGEGPMTGRKKGRCRKGDNKKTRGRTVEKDKVFHGQSKGRKRKAGYGI